MALSVRVWTGFFVGNGPDRLSTETVFEHPFVIERGLRIKLSGEFWGFSDFDDEIAVHAAVTANFLSVSWRATGSRSTRTHRFMSEAMRGVVTASLLVLTIAASPSARAESTITDLRVGYSFMHISDVVVGGAQRDVVFMRHNVDVAVGLGDLSLGLVFQHADKSADTQPGNPESGLMLAVGYDRLLGDWLRLQSGARVALSPGTDNAQPLYATDTDLSSKLVLFDSEGWGPIDNPVFPTAFFGGIVNRFGRVQVMGGAGLWWFGFSTFVSGLYSLNGVEDPAAEPTARRGKFAALKNTGVTASIAYDLDLTSTSQVHLEVRKNFGIANAGNDLVSVVQLRFYFDEAH